jgi:hypothetical protein
MLHHGVPPPSEPSPPTSESSSGYIDALDDNTDASMSSKEEEEESPPPCGPLQATLLGSFETVHMESFMRVVCVVVVEQTNVAIANRVAEISVEFAAKEAATKRLKAAERRAAREFEEKAVCKAGYPAWKAY